MNERPKVEGVHWLGDAYPVNADPERDTWNGQPMTIGRRYLLPDPQGRAYEDDPRTLLRAAVWSAIERLLLPVVQRLDRLLRYRP